MLFRSAAELYTNSQAYIKSLLLCKCARERDKSLLKKEMLACSPLKVKVGSYFHVVRYTSFKIFGLVLYWTAKSIVLYQLSK